MNYTIANLENDYELELERVAKEISGRRSQVAGRRGFRVLLQLPDGLKPWAVCIVDYLSERCDAEIMVWMGSCFGACDLPNTDADLVVQFGHAEW